MSKEKNEKPFISLGNSIAKMLGELEHVSLSHAGWAEPKTKLNTMPLLQTDILNYWYADANEIHSCSAKKQDLNKQIQISFR